MTSRLMLLLISLLLQATQATVLIFWTDSNGDTHCEVRHDLDDCGFANVNPSVDCFPWFSMTGSGNNGPVIVNNAIIEPTLRDEEYLYDDIPPPKLENAAYDNYLVRESCLLRGGSKVEVAKIAKDSDDMALVRLASTGCDSKYRVISVPTAPRKDTGLILFGKDSTFKVGTTSIMQAYGDIIIDGKSLKFN
eukprot:CAMPEP_0185725244 /NCGR_PEP_ID=MMETSP1171-20130828/1538_1 /TAXON_ID=374046 /ORGANISM="Helicotheca tamensis, Strain CCMP826" /LENGTH=191 /DNA_ID=CAMNT_0028393315 /DNA_START=65 /DNA_END=640 /DNA_ORIENTATION=-